jgi:hypothetical protein
MGSACVVLPLVYLQVRVCGGSVLSAGHFGHSWIAGWLGDSFLRLALDLRSIVFRCDDGELLLG